MRVEYDAVYGAMKRTIYFRKLCNVLYFIVGGISEPQIRQQLAPAIPSICCELFPQSFLAFNSGWARSVLLLRHQHHRRHRHRRRCRGATHPDGGRDATVGQPAPRSNQVSTNRLVSVANEPSSGAESPERKPSWRVG